MSEVSGVEFEIQLTDLKDTHFLGVCAQLLLTGDVVFTMHFSDEQMGDVEAIETMISSNLTDNITVDSTNLAEQEMALDQIGTVSPISGISPSSINVHPNSRHQHIFNTQVHQSSGSQLQSTVTFNRRHVGSNATIWDIDNVIWTIPRGGFQTVQVNTWLDVRREIDNGQRLLDAGPTTTPGSTAVSFTIGGGGIASATYAITTQNIVYRTRLDFLQGFASWAIDFDRNTDPARNSSRLNVAIRTSNTRGFVIVEVGGHSVIDNFSGCSSAQTIGIPRTTIMVADIR